MSVCYTLGIPKPVNREKWDQSLLHKTKNRLLALDKKYIKIVPAFLCLKISKTLSKAT